LVLLLALSMLAARAFCTEPSPFESRELSVIPSPETTSELTLSTGTTVVDYDIWPTGPVVLVLLHDISGSHVVSWRVGEPGTTALLNLPTGFDASSIVVHPTGHSFFIAGKDGQQSEILIAENLNGQWTQRVVYQSGHELRRLLVAPRPFEVGWDSVQKHPIESYRLFFAERQPNGAYSTRSITEGGKREYQVIGPESSYVKLPDVDAEEPTPNFVVSALPAAFHPGGHILIWQDGNGCFQQLAYAGKNWDKPSHVAGNPCGGSLTVTPNGAALLHWKRGVPGVAVITDHGRTIASQAVGYQFTTTPSSTPDGRGIVGLFDRAGSQILVYVPIDVPLADVTNAWMFTENFADQQKFASNAGLFRSTGEDQMYQLYDTESYACGGYDSATPTRPYLVTTDIFWELIASAYEGTFIVQERQQAMPEFWAFVTAARQSLKASAPNSTWALALNAVEQSHSASNATTAEAQHIQHAEGTYNSLVFQKSFTFAELKPRGHYSATPEMSAYFKAVHYLTALAAANGATELNSLPPDVKTKATQWIAAYENYIAPSRSPLVWNPDAFVAPRYAQHPLDKQQIFPLSWGFDNEVLMSTVYHADWPTAEQVTGPNGPRLLPSGVDLAAAFGNGYARSLLKTDLAEYPALGPMLNALQQRQPKDAKHSNLYDAWIDALAIQWADFEVFPGVASDTLWKAKRLETGLASWATLRHATVLVNERTAAECGEGGFEAVILRPPRGYVEPDPKTFSAIASLFDEMEDTVAHSSNFKGNLPLGESGEDKTEPLRSGMIRRLRASAEEARSFASIAEKELRKDPLSDAEYEKILHVGAVAEHDFLVYKSLANKDLALSTPDPMMKIADVAGGGATPYFEVAVGRPLEWDQMVPYFGRREIVKGSIYSYYEFPSPSPMTDLAWAGRSDDPIADVVDPSKKTKPIPGRVDMQELPAWVKQFVSTEKLSCPARAPF
jgi:hypothetical protein